MATIHLTTIIEAPIQRVFDLSRSIDLHIASTAHTQEEAIAGRTSGLINLGETVTWRARHFGVWQQLRVQITAMDAPHYFQDAMLQGIFKKMVHDHHFEQQGKQTLMNCTFYFESPLGFLGKLANRLFLKKYMTNFLLIRNQTIKQAAEGEAWRRFLSF